MTDFYKTIIHQEVERWLETGEIGTIREFRAGDDLYSLGVSVNKLTIERKEWQKK